MRDLPPDENLERRYRRGRWTDRGLLVLVLGAVFLGLVLIDYFLLRPPVPKPALAADRAIATGGESLPPASRAGLPRSVIDIDPVAAGEPPVTAGEPAVAAGVAGEASGAAGVNARKGSRATAVPSKPASGSESVQIDFIVASVVPSPRFQLKGGGEKPFHPGSWLQVEVDFTTFPASIDELTLRYLITLRGETFAGDIRHADLFAGAHRSVAYLVPRRTGRYAVDGKLPPRTLDAVVIEAYIDDKLAASGFIGERPAASPEPTEGFVRSLPQTPFLPLAGDQFEPVAPDVPAKPREKVKRVRVPERTEHLTQTSPSKESPTR